MMNDIITNVLFKGRFHEWWCRKTAIPSQTSESQMCIINDSRALVIARNVLLVEEQAI